MILESRVAQYVPESLLSLVQQRYDENHSSKEDVTAEVTVKETPISNLIVLFQVLTFQAMPDTRPKRAKYGEKVSQQVRKALQLPLSFSLYCLDVLGNDAEREITVPWKHSAACLVLEQEEEDEPIEPVRLLFALRAQNTLEHSSQLAACLPKLQQAYMGYVLFKDLYELQWYSIYSADPYEQSTRFEAVANSACMLHPAVTGNLRAPWGNMFGSLSNPFAANLVDCKRPKLAGKTFLHACGI